MRAVFGLVGLLVVMAIVAVLMKQNLAATRAAAVPAAATAHGVKAPQIDITKNLHQQSQQIQKQVQDDLNQALQQGSQRLENSDK